MHHLILGYGYCGYYLAQQLLKEKQKITTVSRHLEEQMRLPGVTHVTQDLNQPFHWTNPDSIIYYLIPPPSSGEQDVFLKKLLRPDTLQAKKMIYFGSSGVYGDHQGDWVSEVSPCHIESSRQKRRLDAEQQWLAYGAKHHISSLCLRIAGIYGPTRLPIQAAQNQVPLIEPSQAPFSNHIYVKDLASIAINLAKKEEALSIYNVSDGAPNVMGTLQQHTAKLLHMDPAPYESFAEVFAKASPMKQEFMRASKQLSIERLKTTLGSSLQLTPLDTALKDAIDHEL